MQAGLVFFASFPLHFPSSCRLGGVSGPSDALALLEHTFFAFFAAHLGAIPMRLGYYALMGMEALRSLFVALSEEYQHTSRLNLWPSR